MPATLARPARIALPARGIEEVVDSHEEIHRHIALVLEGPIGSTLNGLLAALDLRDTETQGHSQRVVRYSLRLVQAVEQCGVDPLSPEEIHSLTLGALVHDVGKIGIPDAILSKPGPLNARERQQMRRHPVMGVRLIGKFPELRPAIDVVLNHHERWDGTGYPEGLAGNRIPLVARIFAVADTLDAMTSNRAYRAAMPMEEACKEIASQGGKQFDPAVVYAFDSIDPAEWSLLSANVSEHHIAQALRLHAA